MMIHIKIFFKVNLLKLIIKLLKADKFYLYCQIFYQSETFGEKIKFDHYFIIS